MDGSLSLAEEDEKDSKRTPNWNDNWRNIPKREHTSRPTNTDPSINQKMLDRMFSPQPEPSLTHRLPSFTHHLR
jgi:hypothetical protein